MLCGNQGYQCHVRNEKIPNISARNQIEGTVVAVKDGAVNSHVTIKDESGVRISGSITNQTARLGSSAQAHSTLIDVDIGDPDTLSHEACRRMGNGIELHVVGDMRASNGKSLNPRSFEIVDA